MTSANFQARSEAEKNGASEPREHLYGGREATAKLNIVVIGCGLGGLATAHCLAEAGHTVQIFEAARKLRELGAGIQVSPNVSRLLIRWGLGERLKQCTVQPEAIVFKRYSDGSVLGYSRWGNGITRELGAPYYHIHRADMHRLILELVLANPRIILNLDSRVKSVQATPNPKVSVTLLSGEVIEGDLIIGADGVHSVTRQVVLGRTELAQPTGDAAYRAVIPTDVMKKDPDLKRFVDVPEMTTWMGPDRHLMSYCIRAKQEFNLVMLHPDNNAIESWKAEGDVEKMRADFADFEPKVRKLLSLVQSTQHWQLVDRAPLSTWVHPDGRVALLGDSCHPMLPYRAQGAAMAIEDAAVLGNLLSRLTSISHLPAYLRAYERIRYARASATQEDSRLSRYIFHLADGPEQEVRDTSMKRAMIVEAARQTLMDVSHAAQTTSETQKKGTIRVGGGRNEESANQWADRGKNEIQFGYDADEEVERWWAEEGSAMVRSLNGERTFSPESSTLASSDSNRSTLSLGKKSFWKKLVGVGRKVDL